MKAEVVFQELETHSLGTGPDKGQKNYGVEKEKKKKNYGMAGSYS